MCSVHNLLENIKLNYVHGQFGIMSVAVVTNHFRKSISSELSPHNCSSSNKKAVLMYIGFVLNASWVIIDSDYHSF